MIWAAAALVGVRVGAAERGDQRQVERLQRQTSSAAGDQRTRAPRSARAPRSPRCRSCGWRSRVPRRSSHRDRTAPPPGPDQPAGGDLGAGRLPGRLGEHQVGAGLLGRQQPGPGLGRGAASPQTTSCGRTSARRATCSVRPPCRKWVGATSPSAAATKAGAAIEASESTAESGKSCRTPLARLVLNIRITRRSRWSTSWAQSAACMLPTSSWCSRASPFAPARPAAAEGGLVEPVGADHPDAAQPRHVRAVGAAALRHARR